MNLDDIVGRMNEERVRAEQRREKLAGELRAVEEGIGRIDVAMAEIEKASRPRRGRRPGTRAATAPAPTDGRRRRAGGRVSAKDAMFRTLERIGRDGGVKAKVLRESAEKRFRREITTKAAGNALWTLKREGRIRREGFFWHLADAPAASELGTSASAPESAADEAPQATDTSPAAEDA